MSLAARLNRLTPALSGKQRALLVIRAHLDSREPDRDLLTVPTDQRREHDYFIALAFVSNNTLGTLLRSLTWIVDALEWNVDEYAMLARAAKMVEEAFEETPDLAEIRKWQKSSNVTLPLFLRGLERDVRASGLQRLLMVWQDLRALEILWAEIAEECDGDDLRHPDRVEEAADTRARLLRLIEATSPKHAKKPPEPSDQALAGVRRHVDEAMRLMGFREPDEHRLPAQGARASGRAATAAAPGGQHRDPLPRRAVALQGQAPQRARGLRVPGDADHGAHQATVPLLLAAGHGEPFRHRLNAHRRGTTGTRATAATHWSPPLPCAIPT